MFYEDQGQAILIMFLVVQDNNFPPEVTSVIPTLVQSSLKLYSRCQELLIGSSFMDGHATSFLGHPPNLRDVFKLIYGCSKIPKVWRYIVLVRTYHVACQLR